MERKYLLPWFARALFFGSILALAPRAIQAQAQPGTMPPVIAPRAEEVLRAACQYLAEAPFFTVSAEVWRERVTETGEKLQFTRLVDLHVKRPDRMHVDIHSALTDRGFWYDGKSLTLLDRKGNLFSSAPMPASLDATLDTSHDEFGIDLPLVDLAVSNPYTNAIARVQSGRYFGIASVLGIDCHHLAFTQDNIDWQLWVEEGPRPLIRKMVITHKNDAGAPEFTALITKWNFVDRISDSDFVFTAPLGAARVEMRRSAAGAGRAAASTPVAPSTQ